MIILWPSLLTDYFKTALLTSLMLLCVVFRQRLIGLSAELHSTGGTW